MKLISALIFAALCLLTTSLRAETIDVFDNHGGSVVRYDQHWSELAARGVSVRIVGPCQSACTVLLGHIPQNRLCVTPQASFGFHLAANQNATAILWNAYPQGVRNWINQRGGLTHDFKWMGAPDVFQYFRRC